MLARWLRVQVSIGRQVIELLLLKGVPSFGVLYNELAIEETL